jgi:hypothetical protein
MRKLLYVEVLAAVALVLFAFNALFLFFDLTEELNAIENNKALGYTVSKAVVYVALMIPSHIYELMPIAVLIGTIFVMARLAQSSEFTILRTSGLGPWQALGIDDVASVLERQLRGALAEVPAERAALVRDLVRRLAQQFAANLDAMVAGQAAPSARPLGLFALLWGLLKAKLLGR